MLLSGRSQDDFFNGLLGRLIRRVADGAPKDVKPPQEPLTDPRDEGILTFDVPGPSWEYAIWGMPG